jgi:hypothetical protein
VKKNYVKNADGFPKFPFFIFKVHGNQNPFSGNTCTTPSIDVLPKLNYRPQACRFRSLFK